MKTILISNVTAEFRAALDEVLIQNPNVFALTLSSNTMHSLIHSQQKHPDEVKQRIIREHLILLNLDQSRKGFQQLCLAISMYAQDPDQLLTKEIYPAIAQTYNYSSAQVEHAIRMLIKGAWKSRYKPTWEQYFPNRRSAPTNKQFICTLAQLLQ